MYAFRKEEEKSDRKKEDIVDKEMSLLKKIFLSKYFSFSFLGGLVLTHK